MLKWTFQKYLLPKIAFSSEGNYRAMSKNKKGKGNMKPVQAVADVSKDFNAPAVFIINVIIFRKNRISP